MTSINENRRMLVNVNDSVTAKRIHHALFYEFVKFTHTPIHDVGYEIEIGPMSDAHYEFIEKELRALGADPKEVFYMKMGLRSVAK